MVTPNKGYSLPIWGTAYISEIDRVRKVTSNADSYEQDFRPNAEIFSLGMAEGTVPQLKFFQTSEIV